MAKAIENEKKSEDLYRKCAEESSDPETKAVFETLANDEHNHQRVLKERLVALKLKMHRF
ncbi:MAG: hypothetical protein M0Z59_07930 [Nitrospiraceae bacterium]|nr:hypothetical protein [Nitrospiraceae bacterium]